MTLRAATRVGSLGCLVVLGGCGGAHTITVDIPATAKADTSEFRRVLIAGFVTEGRSSEVDVNVETVRVLRSALRTKTSLPLVGSADSMPLAENAAPHPEDDCANTTGDSSRWRVDSPQSTTHPTDVDGQVRGTIFGDAVFWKRLGEEYLDPLIITGAVRFCPEYRRGFTLATTFLFIDGRTGAVVHAARFREHLHYGRGRRVSALAAYFELIDRIMPALVNTVSDQRIRVTRTLLK